MRACFRSIAMTIAMFPVVGNVQASDFAGKATFASQDKTSTFTFDWRKGMIFVPVRLNGSRPLAFVLDTGSTRNLVDREIARRWASRPAVQVRCRAPGPGVSIS